MEIAGALGPRLPGRLTPELVLRSPQYMNCLKNYEIDLRGNKIGAIENLGVTEDQFDSIVLTDNEIVILEGIPKLKRLSTLYLSNNRITRIRRGLNESVPNLKWLILNNNKIDNLAALVPLSDLKNLECLSLLGNPVTKLENYRLFVIKLLPELQILDFEKVKQAEVAEASKRDFSGESKVKASFEKDEIYENMKPVPYAQTAATAAASASGPNPEQLTAIKAAIQNAQTLEEVRNLENALARGRIFQYKTDADEDVAMIVDNQENE